MNENCHNSRKSNDLDMKLGLVMKLDTTNMASLKKIDNDIMSANCNFFNLWPIWSNPKVGFQIGAMAW